MHYVSGIFFITAMNKVSVIQGQNSQNRTTVAVLRSGSVVTGRVLARNADGSYSVSLAGQKLNVKSESPLQIGGIFSARVSLKGESVELSLIKENVFPDILQKVGGSSEISPQVANLLSSLGFEPNAESFKILQFMQQIGMKFDVDFAKKALKQARNSENQEEKSQISLLLEEKGIKSSYERVQTIIGRNHQGESEKRKDENGKREVENGKRKTETGKLEKLLGKISLVGDKSLRGVKFSLDLIKAYFSQVDSASLTREVGVLSVFNTVLSSSEKDVPLRHWIMLPFEWNFRSYIGNIRLLFDSELKNLEKVVVNLENPEKKHIFVIDYKKGKADSVRFSSDSPLSDSKKSYLCGLLSSMFEQKIDVSLEDFDSLKGFCAGDERFSLLDGSA